MANVLVIHGPNLNLLGEREPEHYGEVTLDEINAALEGEAKALGHRLEIVQSNAEHQLVEVAQGTIGRSIDFVIINPAAFTHTSVALRDALAVTGLPFIEVHLSNPHAREPFRSRSYFSDLAVGLISGFGARGYLMALQSISSYLDGVGKKN